MESRRVRRVGQRLAGETLTHKFAQRERFLQPLYRAFDLPKKAALDRGPTDPNKRKFRGVPAEGQ